MSDYVQIVSFGPKDSLPSGNPGKLIKGVEQDAELTAISIAIASKFDAADVASQAQAEALTLDTVLITPLRANDILVQAAGAGLSITSGVFAIGSVANTGVLVNANDIELDIVGLTALGGAADPTDLVAIELAGGGKRKVTITELTSGTGFTPTSRIMTAGAGLTGGGDFTSDKTFNVIAGTGITVNVDDVQLDTAHDRNVLHASVDIIAGAGMTGGGTIITSRTLNVIAGVGMVVNANDIALLTSHTRNVDHAAITFTAGDGLVGGGTLAANRTFDLDISGLPAMTLAPIGTDAYLYDDGGVMKRQGINDMRIPSTTEATTHTYVEADMNEARHYSGGTPSHAWTMNINTGEVGMAVLIVNNGTTDGPTLGAGTATIESASGNFVVQLDGMAVLYQVTPNVWKLSGDLVA